MQLMACSVDLRRTALDLGRPAAFSAALGGLALWVISSPFVEYSEKGQLIANTETDVIAFLAVFFIQNGQNLESLALQIKLGELIRSKASAHDTLINLEDLTGTLVVSLRQTFATKPNDAETRKHYIGMIQENRPPPDIGASARRRDFVYTPSKA